MMYTNKLFSLDKMSYPKPVHTCQNLTSYQANNQSHTSHQPRKVLKNDFFFEKLQGKKVFDNFFNFFV